MPASPPGNVFPALVVVGHIVTLIAAWQWRVRKKQGKKKKKAGELVAALRGSLDQRFFCADTLLPAVLIRRPRSLSSRVFLWSALLSLSPSLTPPLLFPLTRLGFLCCGDVAVNPVSAGC